MAVTDQEPILSRIDRLDYMLRQLEEIRGNNMKSSPKSSCASTLSSGTPASDDGHASSVDYSPRSLAKQCRPINHVMMETEVKGSLVESLEHVEDRVLKLEQELEAEKLTKEDEIKKSEGKKERKKGLKQLARQCVRGPPPKQ